MKEKTIGIIEKIRQIPYISVDSAIEMSQDEELYVSIVSEFVLTIDNRADIIEKYYNEEDCHNYTIQVHALKSAARIIGDNELSKMALDLEMAGKDEDWATIQAGTMPLLERFRILKECLGPVFEEEEDESLPLIEESQIAEAVEVMKQGIEDFDFDMVESVMDQLAQYRLPEDFKEIYTKLKVALAEVDYELMEEILTTV